VLADFGSCLRLNENGKVGLIFFLKHCRTGVSSCCVL